MEKNLYLQDLHGKTKIRVSIDGKPDFLERNTNVFIYLNNNGVMPKPNFSFNIESLILKNNQPQRGVFEFDVPIGTISVYMVFSTNRAGHSLDTLHAIVI